MGCNCKDKINIARKSVREGQTERLTKKGKDAEIALKEKREKELELAIQSAKDKKQFYKNKKEAIMNSQPYQIGLEALNRLKASN